MTGDGSWNAGWVVEITDGIITYVGSPVHYAEPEGAWVIDAASGTVMPGVIDAYVRGTEYVPPDYSGQPIRRAFLLDGVTTTCNTGHSLASSESLDSGPFINGVPIGRVYNSGPQLSRRITAPLQPDVAERIYQVETEQEIIAALADLKESGADFVKISVGPVLDPHNPQLLAPVFSAEQVEQIVGYAASLGMRVRGTVVGETYAPRASGTYISVVDFVPAFRSLDSLLAYSNRDPYIFAYTYQDQSKEAVLSAARDIIIEMVIIGKVLVPMITVMDEQYPWTRPVSVYSQVPGRSMYEEVVEFFVDIGGWVALGSGFQPGDTPGMPMDEILALQRSGLTNNEIVTAITYHSAIACGAEAEIGTLEVGKKGDVIVLDSNVLDDITALDRPTHVILDGKRALGQ